MSPTETLKHEHQIILLIIQAAEREALFIKNSGKIHADVVEKLVDFFRNFVDRCHHRKEELHLFVKMRERGLPADTGPIAVMLQEHEEGRRNVAAIAETLPAAKAGRAEALMTVNSRLFAYAELLRQHIGKEDNVLYPMADTVLRPEDQQALTDAFEKIEAEEIGEGVHEKYHQLAHELQQG